MSPNDYNERFYQLVRRESFYAKRLSAMNEEICEAFLNISRFLIDEGYVSNNAREVDNIVEALPEQALANMFDDDTFATKFKIALKAVNPRLSENALSGEKRQAAAIALRLLEYSKNNATYLKPGAKAPKDPEGAAGEYNPKGKEKKPVGGSGAIDASLKGKVSQTEEVETEVEEGYKPIGKKKEAAMYRRAGNLARTSLSSKGKKKEEAQKKSAKIVSAITRQKEDERFERIGKDPKHQNNYKEDVEQIDEFLGGVPGDGYIGHPNLDIKNPLAKKQDKTKVLPKAAPGSGGMVNRLAAQLGDRALSNSYQPEGELIENRRAARAAGGSKDDSRKQPDPSKPGFTGMGNMSIDQIRKMSARIEKEKTKKEEVEHVEEGIIDAAKAGSKRHEDAMKGAGRAIKKARIRTRKLGRALAPAADTAKSAASGVGRAAKATYEAGKKTGEFVKKGAQRHNDMVKAAKKVFSKEELELIAQIMIDEGYDLSDYTWEEFATMCESQEARNNPERYEREQGKKYEPVRGERTPMPPRGDKRREEFEKWYAAQRR